MAADVAALADGVIEYEVVDGRELAITLLRCVGTISRPHLVTRPWAAGPDIATPDAQMIGRTETAIAVMPVAKRETLLSAWERFALPLRATVAPGGGSQPATGSLLHVSEAELSSVRRIEDGALEVRVWNSTPRVLDARVGDRVARLGPGQIAAVRP